MRHVPECVVPLSAPSLTELVYKVLVDSLLRRSAGLWIYGLGCGGLGASQPSIKPSMRETRSESFDMSVLKVSMRVFVRQFVYNVKLASVRPTLRIAMVSSPMRNA